MQLFSGGQWHSTELRRHNGTDWDLLWPCHFERTVRYALEDYVVFKGYSSVSQISANNIFVGNSDGTLASSCHYSLLFFPLEQMRKDIGSGRPLSAAITMTRANKDSGEDTAYLTIAHSLSGVDPKKSDNTWDKAFTYLYLNE